jgi:sulfatase modifying factor 1
LDQFEVTVARFRQFVAAVSDGYRPAKGAGTHTHVNGSKGLVGGDGVTFESGWLEEWNASLPKTIGEWSEALNCSPSFQTWSLTGNNDLPINCVDWIAAYAFCTWDGGFLPSATELNYAAAGGEDQRLYAWGNDAPGKNAALAAYDCYFGGGAGTCSGLANIPEVGSIAAGASKWGQLDLAGSVFEWALDWTGPKASTCDNCAVLATTEAHVRAGGSFSNSTAWLTTTGPSGFVTAPKAYEIGLRCARVP